MNGFSNQFWGWGGEDDDMAARIIGQNLSITRPSQDIARLVRVSREVTDKFFRYTMLKHKHEEGNKENKERFEMLEYVSPRIQKTDGLNNLKYVTKMSIKITFLIPATPL